MMERMERARERRRGREEEKRRAKGKDEERGASRAVAGNLKALPLPRVFSERGRISSFVPPLIGRRPP
jgi:hypothetical protein